MMESLSEVLVEWASHVVVVFENKMMNTMQLRTMSPS
jgi:hypothetical protein